MTTEQTKQFEQVGILQRKFTDAEIDYWQQYSSLNSWQFWFLVGVLVLSLTILYLFIDRRKALLLGFFGFNIHVWLTKFDEIAVANELWNYPYILNPFATASFSLDAAFAPVVFMLVYQWTLNHNKNYYFFATGMFAAPTSAISSSMIISFACNIPLSYW